MNCTGDDAELTDAFPEVLRIPVKERHQCTELETHQDLPREHADLLHGSAQGYVLPKIVHDPSIHHNHIVYI